MGWLWLAVAGWRTQLKRVSQIPSREHGFDCRRESVAHLLHADAEADAAIDARLARVAQRNVDGGKVVDRTWCREEQHVGRRHLELGMLLARLQSADCRVQAGCRGPIAADGIGVRNGRIDWELWAFP